MKSILLCLLATPLLFFSFNCKKIFEVYEKNVSGVQLTDESILKYANAVKALHKLGPGIPQRISEKGDSDSDGLELFGEIEVIIKEAGFINYSEFVKVNAKIAWAWNISQGERGIDNFKALTNDGVKEIEEALANPDVPEETKIELRQARDGILANWENNKKFADITLNIVRPLTNQHDLDVIKRNQKLLMEAYTGIPQETLKEIDPDLFITE